jgi:hypothetical protein
MNKREKTSIPNVVRYPNGDLYYRMGDDERPLGTTDLEEAKDAKDLLEAKTRAFGSRAFKLKMKTLLPAYLTFVREEADYRPRSIKEIEEISNKYLVKFFGNKKMSDIDEALWLGYTKTRVVSDFANHRKVMNLFLKWARENKYYLYRPLFSIPKHKRRRRRNLTPDQITLLFTHAKNEFLLLAVLTLMHQMRGLEAESILIANINLDEKWVDLTDDKVKTKRGRRIPLNDFAVALIKFQIDRVKSSGIRTQWLFPNRKDPKRHVSRLGYRKQWFKVQELAEGQLDGLTWHDFRATGEKHSHKSKEFTDSQKEKFAGSSIEVQKRTYVDMDADDLRGLENSVKIAGLDEIILTKIHSHSQNTTGKRRG